MPTTDPQKLRRIEDHGLIIGICTPRIEDHSPVMRMDKPTESTKMACCDYM